MNTMRIIEIIMRIICFVIGVFFSLGAKISVYDAGAAEVFANALLAFIYLIAVVALLVLPWALPLRN